MNTNSNITKWKGIAFILLLLVIYIISYTSSEVEDSNIISTITNKDVDKTFTIISSSENEALDLPLKEFAKKQGFNLKIDYAGTLEIMDRLNAGEMYDAVWASNSIWLYMLDSNVVKTSNSKSISINPVVFAVKKSKAEELGLDNPESEIYVRDIVNYINDGSLKFAMANPTQTNSGATAYLGLLTTLAGSPEILTSADINNESLKVELNELFSKLTKSSGSESFLEEMIVRNDYSFDTVVTYESSLININKQLEMNHKEPFYLLYPVDGVSISDSPFASITKDENKLEYFHLLQDFLLSDDGESLLEENGRRTWYGGVNENAPQTIFKPDWGIDTTKYLSPVKYPSTDNIKLALNLYQTEFRKPIFTIFALDYSGSMLSNQGYEQLVEAMDFVLDPEKARENYIQYTDKDAILVIPFASFPIETWTTENGSDTVNLRNNIKNLQPGGATNIYDTLAQAIQYANTIDTSGYQVSIILMTDGKSNRGSYSNFEAVYDHSTVKPAVYSIMFGDADKTELSKIAHITGGKIFDGKTGLLRVFKEVRAYN